uniref:C-type lectin domain-containing protein n=2 Tax=Pyxicephalus adspersus TaxID=30357 RepID=A0AAV3ABK2_PYXAD|nr:TPA: hypothetical protein GDO54_018183 [Pyxicephalus adspersus]
MDWKKGMFLRDLGIEMKDSTSPVLSTNQLDWEPEIRSERELYAELEFMTLASLVQQEASNQEANKLIHPRTIKKVECSIRCCLNVGNVVLIVVLLTASIVFLSLHLLVSYQQHNIKQKAEQLRINQSRCQEDLGNLKEMNMILQNNITLFIQDNKSRQELMLSQHVQNTQRMELRYQLLYQNYSRLQNMYNHLWSSHVFLHRESAIMGNCHQRNPSDHGVVCPFCQSSWQFFGVSCYILSSSAANWQESARWCRIQGGHLVVVSNLEEQNFLQDLVKETTWIGLSDRDFEGDWRWVDGTPYAKSDKTSNLWMPNQPDNLGNEDCVTLSPGSGWKDEKCFKHYQAICEHGAFHVIVNGNTISN